jgi:hypothetical protein
MTLNKLVSDDFVCIDRRGVTSKAKVTGITVTQIKVGTLKFRKSDGGIVGGDAWSNMSIVPWTDAHEKSLNEHLRIKNIKRVLHLVSSLDPQSISQEDLETLNTLINKPVKQAQNNNK